jgi:glucose 1-dehydrogenase
MSTQAEIVASYPTKPLVGQKALVTGANSGIGEAVARHLAAAGAAVAINYVVQPDIAQAVVDDIVANGGEAMMTCANVANEPEVLAMFEEVIAQFGTLDIVVNNAGLQRDSSLVDMTIDQWNMVIGVNLTGQFLCARSAVREYLRRGPTPHSAALGKIIHMSSVHEVIPWAGHVNYATSKGGVNMLMKSIAQEVGKHKIRVNSISPGAIKTPINVSAWSTPEAEAKLLELIPYDRVGIADDIGKAAVWLSSDASDYVTGTSIYVDGGMTLYEGFATNG